MTFRRWNFVLVISFLVASLFHWGVRVFLHEAYPRGTFLFSPWDRYRDLLNLLPHIRAGDPYRWNGSVYFPMAYLVLQPFAWLRDLQATVLFFIVSILGMFRCLTAFEVPLVGVLGMLMFSYPFWFVMDRANPEIFVFFFLASFLNAFMKKSRWASVWLALATATKGYPAVFLVLLLKHKKWADLFWSASLAILFSILAGSLFEGGLKATHQQLLGNLSFHHGLYVVGDLCMRFNLGLYGWIKFWFIPSSPASSLWFLPRYFIVALGVFALMAMRVIFFKARDLELDVLILSLAMLILPELSYDYKLLHLYLPILVYFGRRSFLELAPLGEDAHLPRWMDIILPVLIPCQYWILKDEVGVGSILRPPFLALLFVALLISYRSSFWRGLRYRGS